jgi:hypothetical protein
MFLDWIPTKKFTISAKITIYPDERQQKIMLLRF